MVAAKAAEAEIVKIEIRKKALVSLGETQRIAAHSWEIRTFFSVQHAGIVELCNSSKLGVGAIKRLTV